MKAHEFCYWLQGFFELSPGETKQPLSADQVECIKKHLSMVFIHDIDPKYPASQKAALDAAHGGHVPAIGTGVCIGADKDVFFRC